MFILIFRLVGVFDNLFIKEDVDNLKMYVTQQGPSFQYSQYDSDIMEATDNVKWKKQFEVSVKCLTGLLDSVQSVQWHQFGFYWMIMICEN